MKNKKPRILIVDDTANICDILEFLFKKQNYDVFTAPDPVLGYEKALSIEPHVILSDYMMPKEDGLSFCHRVRNTAVIKDCIFIIMTNKDLNEQTKEKFHDLPDGWISKFKGYNTIVAEVNNWLDCTFDNLDY
jgi:DNA-binding response OmpR family regulator